MVKIFTFALLIFFLRINVRGLGGVKQEFTLKVEERFLYNMVQLLLVGCDQLHSHTALPALI